MVAVAEKTTVTTNQERAIYDELFNRGALTPAQVASAVNADETSVEAWLAEKARRRTIDFDPQFGRYSTFE